MLPLDAPRDSAEIRLPQPPGDAGHAINDNDEQDSEELLVRNCGHVPHYHGDSDGQQHQPENEPAQTAKIPVPVDDGFECSLDQRPDHVDATVDLLAVRGRFPAKSVSSNNTPRAATSAHRQSFCRFSISTA